MLPTKTLIIMCAMIICTSIVKAQGTVQRDSLYKNTDFEIISGKFFNQNSTAPQTGIIVDLSKRPLIKGTVPIHQGNIDALFAEASVTSNNEFVPLFDKGKWAPNVSADLSYTIFLNRDNRYWGFDSVTVSGATFVKPTQTFWTWLNAKAGYTLSSYLFYLDNNNTDIQKQISRKNYHNLFGQINLGFYLDPFQNKLAWLSFAGNAGFEYRQNDNNYAAMQSVVVKSYNKIAQSDGTQALDVTSEETSAKQGVFTVANSAAVNYNLTMLINSANNVLFGLNFYGRTRLTKALRSTDIGFGVNIPVQRTRLNHKETVVNLGLNYEVPDITNNLTQNTRFSDKGLLGLSIAIPIYTLDYK